MLSSLRSKCLQLAQEAAAAQQAPLQYTLRGAAEPAIPRLMQVAICCQQRKLVEASECAGQRAAVCGCWVTCCAGPRLPHALASCNGQHSAVQQCMQSMLVASTASSSL